MNKIDENQINQLKSTSKFTQEELEQVLSRLRINMGNSYYYQGIITLLRNKSKQVEFLDLKNGIFLINDPVKFCEELNHKTKLSIPRNKLISRITASDCIRLVSRPGTFQFVYWSDLLGNSKRLKRLSDSKNQSTEVSKY